MYERVKGVILRVYKLVPEAYQQRFRNLKKVPAQTYADFAREKGVLFDRFCTACKADNFAAVHELMLLEELKNCLPCCLSEWAEGSHSAAGCSTSWWVHPYSQNCLSIGVPLIMFRQYEAQSDLVHLNAAAILSNVKHEILFNIILVNFSSLVFWENWNCDGAITCFYSAAILIHPSSALIYFNHVLDSNRLKWGHCRLISWVTFAAPHVKTKVEKSC